MDSRDLLPCCRAGGRCGRIDDTLDNSELWCFGAPWWQSVWDSCNTDKIVDVDFSRPDDDKNRLQFLWELVLELKLDEPRNDAMFVCNVDTYCCPEDHVTNDLGVEYIDNQFEPQMNLAIEPTRGLD